MTRQPFVCVFPTFLLPYKLTMRLSRDGGEEKLENDRITQSQSKKVRDESRKSFACLIWKQRREINRKRRRWDCIEAKQQTLSLLNFSYSRADLRSHHIFPLPSCAVISIHSFEQLFQFAHSTSSQMENDLHKKSFFFITSEQRLSSRLNKRK